MSRGQNSLPYLDVEKSRIFRAREVLVCGEHSRHPLTETWGKAYDYAVRAVNPAFGFGSSEMVRCPQNF